MSKKKKPKIDELDKLHKIIDDLYDSKIREKKHKSLTKETSEAIIKKPDSIETKFIVHKKEEKIDKPVTEEFKHSPSKTDDLIEIEKTEISKSEFLEVRPKEAPKKVETEKIEGKTTDEKIDIRPEIKTKKEKRIDETPSYIDKDKIFTFKEVELDEIYRKTKKGFLSSNKIQMYKPITILEIWAFTLILTGLSISGLFLLRDWLFSTFGILGDKLIPTIAGTQNVHILFGFAIIILGLIHIIIHIFSKKKDILPKETLRDFRAFLHSGFYLLGFARKETYDNSGRFYGRQRIVYLSLFYILGLSGLTGILIYTEIFSDDLAIVHVIPAGLSIMVLLFHFLINIRKHDIESLKCAFLTGKLPRWYVKKNYPTWHKEIRNERKSIFEKLHFSKKEVSNKSYLETGNELTNALIKFAYFAGDLSDLESIKAYSEELKNTIPKDKLDRIIELSNELEDKIEEEIKQEANDESQQEKDVE